MSTTDNWMVGAVLLDGQGGAKLLDETQVNKWTPKNGILWIHLNLSHPKTVLFLQNDKYLDD